jgi:hypothetical protein
MGAEVAAGKKTLAAETSHLTALRAFRSSAAQLRFVAL